MLTQRTAAKDHEKCLYNFSNCEGVIMSMLHLVWQDAMCKKQSH